MAIKLFVYLLNIIDSTVEKPERTDPHIQPSISIHANPQAPKNSRSRYAIQPTHLEKQTEADPLVVSVHLLLLVVVGRLDAGTSRQVHVRVRLLPVGVRGHRERGVYPAEGVEHILGYLLGVDAIDGIAHVLPGGHYQTERYQYGHGDGVVQAEHGAVYVDVADADEGLQASEDVQHLSPVARVVVRASCTP